MTDDTTFESHRDAAADAIAQGDSRAADEFYAAELAALEAEQPDDQAEEGQQGYAEGIFDSLSQDYDSETVDQLRSHWVDDTAAAEGVALGQALIGDFPELGEIAESFDLADHPALLLMAERLARRAGYTFDSQPKDTQVNDRQITANEDALQRIRAQIATAQANGQSARADRLFKQEMDLIARINGGDGRIVDGRRTV